MSVSTQEPHCRSDFFRGWNADRPHLWSIYYKKKKKDKTHTKFTPISQVVILPLEGVSVVYDLQPHRQGRRPHGLANTLQGQQQAVGLGVLHLGDLVQGLQPDLQIN